MMSAQNFEPTHDGRSTTMGNFVRDLFLDQFYFETIFPRIPTLVERNIKSKLEEMRLPTKPLGNGGTGGGNSRAIDNATSNKRPPSVKVRRRTFCRQRAERGSGLKVSV